MTRIQCHKCAAVYADVDRLEEPKAARSWYFVPELEVDDG